MRHVLITAVVLVMTTLHAQRVCAQQPGAESEPAARSIPEEDLNKTQHSVRIGGEEVRYTATAGTLLLKDEAGEPKAKAFFVAYTRNGMPGGRARPITFAYNGGPGSASIWLHMGPYGAHTGPYVAHMGPIWAHTRPTKAPYGTHTGPYRAPKRP